MMIRDNECAPARDSTLRAVSADRLAETSSPAALHALAGALCIQEAGFQLVPDAACPGFERTVTRLHTENDATDPAQSLKSNCNFREAMGEEAEDALRRWKGR